MYAKKKEREKINTCTNDSYSWMYDGGLRTSCSGIPATKTAEYPVADNPFLPPLTDTLARYNNAERASRNASRTYYFASSFFWRARAAKTIGFYFREPRAWGAVLLKIHSSPPLPTAWLKWPLAICISFPVGPCAIRWLAASALRKRGGKLEPRTVSRQDTTAWSVCRTKKRPYTQLHAAFS